MDIQQSTIDTTLAAPETASRVDWVGVALFLFLTFALSWASFIGLRALGVAFTVSTLIGMFGPAVAALLTRLLRREGFRDAGLRLVARGHKGGGWMYLAAYLVPPLLLAASIVFVLLTTYQHWDIAHGLQLLVQQVKRAGRNLPSGVSSEQLGLTLLISQIVAALSFGILINMFATIGEEFGWRGYLLPRLAQLGGIPAAIVVGLIWGLWHAPLIVLDGYNYPGHPWLGILMMMLFCVALSMIFTWLRFRSGSVWPSTLAHAAVNAQAGFAILALTPGDALLRSPTGLLGVLPALAFAIFLAISGRLKADTAR